MLTVKRLNKIFIKAFRSNIKLKKTSTRRDHLQPHHLIFRIKGKRDLQDLTHPWDTEIKIHTGLNKIKSFYLSKLVNTESEVDTDQGTNSFKEHNLKNFTKVYQPIAQTVTSPK